LAALLTHVSIAVTPPAHAGKKLGMGFRLSALPGEGVQQEKNNRQMYLR
jgi:hypothetical protein